MESLADIYLEKLNTDKQPGFVLTKFYCELFDLQFNKNYVSVFSKLVKIYGKEQVFESLLSISVSNIEDPGKIFGLLNYICKKNLLKGELNPSQDLTTLIESNKNKIEKMKRKNLIIRSPFDDTIDN